MIAHNCIPGGTGPCPPGELFPPRWTSPSAAAAAAAGIAKRRAAGAGRVETHNMARLIVCHRHASNIASQKNCSYLMSLQRGVCVRVCVCARAGRGIPTAQSPEKSLRAAPGVLFVLILEGKLPPPTRTPRSRRFPPQAPRLRVRLSPRTAPGHHHPKTRIATAARSPPGGHSGSAAAPVRHGRSRPRT